MYQFALLLWLQAALGATGAEGPFRAACEGVMACFRCHGPFLELLLATLLQDPAIDWSAEREVSATVC
jgi:phosphatidylinositol kinase/protein kinase (PI-3  family)